MLVKPVKTEKILPGKQTIYDLLDKYLPKPEECNIIAVTSKVVSLCEGQVLPLEKISKQELAKQEADYYLPDVHAPHGYSFTIIQNTLIPMAGVDESNGNGHYVLWPKDSQATANGIRQHLREKHNIKEIGVVITDSTCVPLRWGVIGIALAYSGFKAINDYTNKKDLFGRSFEVSQAGVAMGLASTAVLAMGEGTEQTPIAVISDVPFVKFQQHNPTHEDLEFFYIKNKEEDLFAPFLNAVKWHKGKNVQD
jgi:putative folate metabolism gamma-glutamate ligase